MTKDEQDRVIAHVKNMMRTHQVRKTRVKNMAMSQRAANEANHNDFVKLRLMLAKSGSVALQKTGALPCKKP